MAPTRRGTWLPAAGLWCLASGLLLAKGSRAVRDEGTSMDDEADRLTYDSVEADCVDVMAPWVELKNTKGIGRMAKFICWGRVCPYVDNEDFERRFKAAHPEEEGLWASVQEQLDKGAICIGEPPEGQSCKFNVNTALPWQLTLVDGIDEELVKKINSARICPFENVEDFERKVTAQKDGKGAWGVLKKLLASGTLCPIKPVEGKERNMQPKPQGKKQSPIMEEKPQELEDHLLSLGVMDGENSDNKKDSQVVESSIGNTKSTSTEKVTNVGNVGQVHTKDPDQEKQDVGHDTNQGSPSQNGQSTGGSGTRSDGRGLAKPNLGQPQHLPSSQGGGHLHAQGGGHLHARSSRSFWFSPQLPSVQPGLMVDFFAPTLGWQPAFVERIRLVGSHIYDVSVSYCLYDAYTYHQVTMRSGLWGRLLRPAFSVTKSAPPRLPDSQPRTYSLGEMWAAFFNSHMCMKTGLTFSKVGNALHGATVPMIGVPMSWGGGGTAFLQWHPSGLVLHYPRLGQKICAFGQRGFNHFRNQITWLCATYPRLALLASVEGNRRLTNVIVTYT